MFLEPFYAPGQGRKELNELRKHTFTDPGKPTGDIPGSGSRQVRLPLVPRDGDFLFRWLAPRRHAHPDGRGVCREGDPLHFRGLGVGGAQPRQPCPGRAEPTATHNLQAAVFRAEQATEQSVT